MLMISNHPVSDSHFVVLGEDGRAARASDRKSRHVTFVYVSSKERWTRELHWNIKILIKSKYRTLAT